jgi:hypothetical protein
MTAMTAFIFLFLLCFLQVISGNPHGINSVRKANQNAIRGRPNDRHVLPPAFGGSFNLTRTLNPPIDPTKEIITIVASDNIRGYLNWLQTWFRDAGRTHCTTQCIITDDRSKLNKADVVLFHAPTHGKIPMPPRRQDKDGRNSAIYAFLSMEQPKYAKYLADKKYLSRRFDLLLTYSLNTYYPGTRVPNMPITYYPLNILPPEAILEPQMPFNEKTGFGTGVSVVAFISNCKAAGANERVAFLEELMKYIPVHSYGGCLNNRKEPTMANDPAWPVIAQKRARKIKILKNYKFYLAFENAPVDDYVSEKVFEGLFAGTVPIYRGAPKISLFMPSDKSFIDANKMNANQIANMIKSLGNDEEKYNAYMKYKQEPLPESFKRITLQSYTHPNVICRLCEYAQKQKNKTIYTATASGRNLTFSSSNSTNTSKINNGVVNEGSVEIDDMQYMSSNTTNSLLQHVRWSPDKKDRPKSVQH